MGANIFFEKYRIGGTMAFMEAISFIIIGLFAGAILIGAFMWFLHKQTPAASDREYKSFLLLQNQIEHLSRVIDAKLGESNKEMQLAVRTQFAESQRLIRDITEQITHVKETNKQVISVADQLRTLQNTLQNPKQRGVLGEYYLDTVLKNMFAPNQYQLQYAFVDGEIVDAAIFIKDKIIPVDSKFSLENYNHIVNETDQAERLRLEKVFVQDIKGRIDETAKYIRPAENTMDFAFMFIPSEAIYYDLLINKIGAMKSSTRDLIEYAFREKRVIIVSPTSFMAYLQTVLQGLRALQIEESAKEIRKRVEDLVRHIGSYETYMKKLGAHLGTAVNTYNTAYKEFGKIDKDVMRITGESNEVEALS